AGGRRCVAGVGDGVGLSPAAVTRRVDRLLDAGAVRGFAVVVAPDAIGWTTAAFIELHCRARTSPGAIRAGLAKHPEVIFACTVTGDTDALVQIRARNTRHLQEVIERIGAEPFVTRTKSTLVLSRLLDRPSPSGGAGVP